MSLKDNQESVREAEDIKIDTIKHIIEGILADLDPECRKNIIKSLYESYFGCDTTHQSVKSIETFSYKNPNRGISYSKPHRKWRVRVMKDGKSHHIGMFSDKNAALAAYEEAKAALYMKKST
jgi:hypothetical protein